METELVNIGRAWFTRVCGGRSDGQEVLVVEFRFGKDSASADFCSCGMKSAVRLGKQLSECMNSLGQTLTVVADDDGEDLAPGPHAVPTSGSGDRIHARRVKIELVELIEISGGELDGRDFVQIHVRDRASNALSLYSICIEAARDFLIHLASRLDALGYSLG